VKFTGSPLRIALVGNPNCGKTTLFNRLTGSRGKVGNMPGVTVSAVHAAVRGEPGWTLTDLPGTYSLHATAPDERITQEALLRGEVDAVWLVMDSAALRSNLFLALQVIELGFPVAVILNRTDATPVDADALRRELGVDVVEVDGVKTPAKDLLGCVRSLNPQQGRHAGKHNLPPRWQEALNLMQPAFDGMSVAMQVHMLRRGDVPEWLDADRAQALTFARDHITDSPAARQLNEASWRMEFIRDIATAVLPDAEPEDAQALAKSARRTTRADAILTHPIAGNLILAAVFFVIFQAVYAWSAWPMDQVDAAFGWLLAQLSEKLPDTWWRSLLVDGVLAGIAGIVVFVPQIMVLFGLTAALDQTGYMARVSFLGDRFMARLGLNGRSIVPLVGGLACAVPAVMAARSISGKRERLLTILVTPLMTCSARLPVYAFLIGFLVPDAPILGGLFNQQGLFLFGIYVLSGGAALGLAFALHRSLPERQESHFTLEWPAYRLPRLADVGREMARKGWTFVSSAGKVILVVSLVLWALARFGPTDDMQAVEAAHIENPDSPEAEAARLEASWIGHIGRAIEPAVRPLGYDGKMGIAILTSFAAREVFVGTLSTLYPSAGSDYGSISALQKQLATEIHPSTGQPLLNRASAASLILFYMFAMQCMSTVVIVQRELKSWAWALGQAVGFTVFAYGLALLVYQILS
jgi:ferrous iron transport protein B